MKRFAAAIGIGEPKKADVNYRHEAKAFMVELLQRREDVTGSAYNIHTGGYDALFYGLPMVGSLIPQAPPVFKDSSWVRFTLVDNFPPKRALNPFDVATENLIWMLHGTDVEALPLQLKDGLEGGGYFSRAKNLHTPPEWFEDCVFDKKSHCCFTLIWQVVSDSRLGVFCSRHSHRMLGRGQFSECFLWMRVLPCVQHVLERHGVKRVHVK